MQVHAIQTAVVSDQSGGDRLVYKQSSREQRKREAKACRSRRERPFKKDGKQSANITLKEEAIMGRTVGTKAKD